MADSAPKPEELPVTAQIDPSQVAEAAALEDQHDAEDSSVLPIEIQEVTEPDTSARIVDNPVRDDETEARIQELRNRGRVGVLTEGTERPDASHRMKNTDHDPDAIAAANKANRQAQQERAEHIGDRRKPTVGETFKRATNIKLDTVAGKYNDSPVPDVKAYFEDPAGWEEKLRSDLRDRGRSDEQIEGRIEDLKSIYDRELARIGEKSDEMRDDWLQEKYLHLDVQTRDQDAFRGDLLDLYARDPEKYKAMSTEEFVAEGREFRRSSWETSARATLQSLGSALNETLPKLVEDASSLDLFCREMNKQFNDLLLRIVRQDIDVEELYSFVEAIEGKEGPYPQIPEDPADGAAYEKALDDRYNTIDRAEYASMHGYFTVNDFVKDLDRSPREQMKEAVERAKVVTDRWVEAGKKAREEFETKWGKAPNSEEPEPQAA